MFECADDDDDTGGLFDDLPSINMIDSILEELKGIKIAMPEVWPCC